MQHETAVELPREDAPRTKTSLPLVARVGISLGLMGLLLFAVAGRLDWLGGWVFVGLIVFSLVLNAVVVRLTNPVLARERWKEREDTKPFDRLFPIVYLGMMLVMVVIGGLDNGRFGTSSLPGWCLPAGALLHVLGQLPMLWAYSTNPHLEATVRVQKDREHRVITTGPYRFVRHPMYIGLILMLVGWPLVFGSLWVYVPAAVSMAALVVRTALEDRTLQEELPGYVEYTRRTRYRLVPGLW
jgi:protein-S-isoprenylcysteine O-methyltransferase Ste14